MRSTLICSTVAVSASGTRSGSVQGSRSAADGWRSTGTGDEVPHAARADAHALTIRSRLDLPDIGTCLLRRHGHRDRLLDHQLVAEPLGLPLGRENRLDMLLLPVGEVAL